MPDALHILPLTAADAASVAALEQTLFPDAPWSASAVQAEAENRFSKSYLARADGAVVGYLMGRCVCGDGSLERIAVLPAYRGRGFGRALLERLFAELRAAHATQISLEVRRSNAAAIRLYTAFGFETVGVRSRFYRRPTEDALLMQCRLMRG